MRLISFHNSATSAPDCSRVEPGLEELLGFEEVPPRLQELVRQMLDLGWIQARGARNRAVRVARRGFSGSRPCSRCGGARGCVGEEGRDCYDDYMQSMV